MAALDLNELICDIGNDININPADEIYRRVLFAELKVTKCAPGLQYPKPWLTHCQHKDNVCYILAPLTSEWTVLQIVEVLRHPFLPDRVGHVVFSINRNSIVCLEMGLVQKKKQRKAQVLSVYCQSMKLMLVKGVMEWRGNKALEFIHMFNHKTYHGFAKHWTTYFRCLYFIALSHWSCIYYFYVLLYGFV